MAEMIKFIGRTFEEAGEMRGSLTFLAEGEGASDRVRYFKGFEEMTKILAEECTKITGGGERDVQK